MTIARRLELERIQEAIEKAKRSNISETLAEVRAILEELKRDQERLDQRIEEMWKRHQEHNRD